MPGIRTTTQVPRPHSGPRTSGATSRRSAAGPAIGKGWTPREQRHTFVSVLSDSGVDIEQIADAVGHVNSTVTKAVYRHQIADEITSAATVMDSIFGEAKGS